MDFHRGPHPTPPILPEPSHTILPEPPAQRVLSPFHVSNFTDVFGVSPSGSNSASASVNLRDRQTPHPSSRILPEPPELPTFGGSNFNDVFGIRNRGSEGGSASSSIADRRIPHSSPPILPDPLELPVFGGSNFNEVFGFRGSNGGSASSNRQDHRIPQQSSPEHFSLSTEHFSLSLGEFGGSNFKDVFGFRNGGNNSGCSNSIHQERQHRFALALEKSAAGRVTKSEQTSSQSNTSIPVHAKPTSKPSSGFIGVWLDDDEDDFIDALLTACPSDDDDEEDEDIPSPTVYPIQRVPELFQRMRTRSNSSGPSPRSRTLAVPGDVLEQSFYIPDSVRGPASFWHIAQRHISQRDKVEPAGFLASLDADLCRLRLESLSKTPEPSRGSRQSSSQVVAKASEREGTLKKAAEAELERTLQRLKALEVKSVPQPAATAATALATPSTSFSLQGQTGSTPLQPRAKTRAQPVTSVSRGTEVDKFLEENKNKDGVVTLPSGLQYKVLKSGDGQFHPRLQSQCTVAYTGKLVDGTQFDMSWSFSTSPGKVIKGWSEALQLMVEGDKWELYVPADLGYGSKGLSSMNIPGGATLIFQMELLEVKGEKVDAARAKASASTPGASVASDSSPVSSLLQHAQLIQKFLSTKEEIEKFRKLPAEKDFRNQTKQVIVKKVGQISANAKSIQECSRVLCEYITQVSQGGSLERTRFMEYVVADRLADEAEVGVKASAKAAWPIAYVAAQIFHKFPSIEELFQGIMHAKCPFLAADYSATLAEKNLSMDMMIGYQRLWLAVAVIQEDLGTVWRWLARSMNSSPVPMIATFVHCTLEMAGFAAHSRYKRQFVKLISFLEQQYMPELLALKSQTSGEEADRLRASLSRLQVWIANFQKHGQAPAPEGQRIEARQESELDPNM